MNAEEPGKIIIEQLQILTIFLARPSVQRQLLALLAIFIAAWMIPAFLRAKSRKRRAVNDTEDGVDRFEIPLRWRKRLDAFYLIYAPLLAILLIHVFQWIFALLGHPYGMLTESKSLLWAWLFYRLVLMILYIRYGEAIRPYHHWMFLPLLFWLLLTQIADNFVNVRIVVSLPVFTLFGASITIGQAMGALTAIYWGVAISWLAKDGMRRALMAKTKIESGVVESIVTLTRYVILAMGVFAALFILGVDLASLALIGGGLSIGVGIGLQKIVSNFISGLMLLSEQSMLPGDVIDINGRLGTVEQVNIRSTTIRTINNVDLVVPNETFITTEVTTFTKGDTRVRLLIPIDVSYHSDPRQVRQVVSKTAAEHSLVLSHPAPDLLFRGFGDSSLNFELAVWIDQPIRAPRIASDLYYMIWEALKAHQIEVPFPQYDLHLRRGWEAVTGQ
jgi:small-conductance mechanosensitive channel